MTKEGITIDAITENEWFHKRIPFLGNSRLERIHKGYSNDRKYLVRDSEGVPRYILRTYDIDQDPGKRLEYSRLEMMEKQGVNCSRPVDIGVLPEQQLGYMIVSFIEGNDATDELPLLTEDEQLKIGVQAGRELKKIHGVGCPVPMKTWEERMLAKHRRYRTEYAKCGVSIHNDTELLSFIDRSLHWMKDRPNLFQHDDYHVGNLIVKDGNLSGVIDFNRYDWGDPYHDFVKVGIFSAEISVPFSIGQIREYHSPLEPDELFWSLYSLYLAMTLVSSVLWVLKVCPDELNSMMKKINKVMDDHDNFESVIPQWYGRSTTP
jgi:aminoglycoside phosphotransferase (APT) family kinase protein